MWQLRGRPSAFLQSAEGLFAEFPGPPAFRDVSCGASLFVPLKFVCSISSYVSHICCLYYLYIILIYIHTYHIIYTYIYIYIYILSHIYIYMNDKCNIHNMHKHRSSALLGFRPGCPGRSTALPSSDTSATNAFCRRIPEILRQVIVYCSII